MFDNLSLFFLRFCLLAEPPLRWLLALVGAILFVLLIVGLTVYRSWVYEQELDSLLWKVDMKELITSDIPVSGKTSKVQCTASGLAWQPARLPLSNIWGQELSSVRRSKRKSIFLPLFFSSSFFSFS